MANTAAETGCAPGGCQWRLYEPQQGVDSLFLTTAEIPRNVHWQKGFTSVYYRLGRTLFRASRRPDPRPAMIFSLPEGLREQEVVDIWPDPGSGFWRIKTLEYSDGRPVAGIWERSSAGRWRVLAKVATECECGGCPCAEVVNDYVQKGNWRALVNALDSMRIENAIARWNRERTLEEGLLFLLIAEEYSGACGRVLDLETGNLHVLPAPSVSAVWVEPPA